MNIEQYLNLEHFSTRWLCGRVDIAFRSDMPRFWQIWRVAGSTPLSGGWFFSFVQIIFHKLFLYVWILYNDKKQSKGLGYLSRLSLNFRIEWRVSGTLSPRGFGGGGSSDWLRTSEPHRIRRVPGWVNWLHNCGLVRGGERDGISFFFNLIDWNRLCSNKNKR